MLAVCFGMKAFVKNSDTYIKTLPDNTATVYGIYKMGSNNSNRCHKIICDMWNWVEQNIWITAAHIPGQYEEADKESQKIREKDKEWMLNENVLEKIIHHFQFYPTIGLFTSRLNKQLPLFVIQT